MPNKSSKFEHYKKITQAQYMDVLDLTNISSTDLDTLRRLDYKTYETQISVETKAFTIPSRTISQVIAILNEYGCVCDYVSSKETQSSNPSQDGLIWDDNCDSRLAQEDSRDGASPRDKMDPMDNDSIQNSAINSKCNLYLVKSSLGIRYVSPACSRAFKTKHGIKYHLNGRCIKCALNDNSLGEMTCPIPDCDEAVPCNSFGWNAHLLQKHVFLPSQSRKKLANIKNSILNVMQDTMNGKCSLNDLKQAAKSSITKTKELANEVLDNVEQDVARKRSIKEPVKEKTSKKSKVEQTNLNDLDKLIYERMEQILSERINNIPLPKIPGLELPMQPFTTQHLDAGMYMQSSTAYPNPMQCEYPFSMGGLQQIPLISLNPQFECTSNLANYLPLAKCPQTHTVAEITISNLF
jgi:hypothetical protein